MPFTFADEDRLARTPAHELALSCIRAGIEAATPRRAVDRTVSLDGSELVVRPGEHSPGRRYDLDAFDDIIVLGGGNAAAHLAGALEDVLGDRLTDGVVVTDDPVSTTRVDVEPGDHPVPSQRGVESTRSVLDTAARAGENDLVLAAFTGGGSALLPAPAGDLTLDDLQATTETLLASGATIDEINAVRKHCSAIKGGRLARLAAPATVVGVVISDVVGDDLATIASGPLAPDPTTYGDAIAVLDRYDVTVPETVREHLQRGDGGDVDETPTAADRAFERVDMHVIASATDALEAAREVAEDRGYDAMLLSTRVRGEASEAAKTHVAIAEECRATGNPISPPAVVLSGGETTVTLSDDHGSGGPNQEFALSAACELAADDVVLASVDTDGIDGNTDAAGALVDAGTVDPAAGRDALDRNDAYPALDDAGALIRTGPSGTNVNDLRVIVIGEKK